VIAAALAAAAIAAPDASAAGVVVQLPDRQVRIDEPTLRGAADVPAGTSTLRAAPEASDTIAHPPAVSLPRVLELAGVAPDALSFITVRRPNGTLSVLRAGDLSRPAPFPEGPPLVWLDADSVRYLRPVRDDADVNGADNIATAGEDLLVRVHQGALLQVMVRVEPAAPRAGERAHLEARVSGAQRGTTVTVRWRFGDGGEASGPAVAHRWRRAGVYTIVATADGDDDSGGAAEPLVVTVGAPRRRPGATGGGNGDRERAPATGPSEPREDTKPAAPAPADAPPAASPGSPPRAAPQATASSRPATPPRSPRRDRARRARRARDGDADPPGTVPVRGVLVSATLPASTLAARPGAPTDRTDAILPAGVAIAAGLLALGAWRERRRRPQ
jgi:hypothetical protein